MDIVILGGEVIYPYDLCMMEDQGDEEPEPEMGCDTDSDEIRRKRAKQGVPQDSNGNFRGTENEVKSKATTAHYQ